MGTMFCVSNIQVCVFSFLLHKSLEFERVLGFGFSTILSSINTHHIPLHQVIVEEIKLH